MQSISWLLRRPDFASLHARERRGGAPRTRSRWDALVEEREHIRAEAEGRVVAKAWGSIGGGRSPAVRQPGTGWYGKAPVVPSPRANTGSEGQRSFPDFARSRTSKSSTTRLAGARLLGGRRQITSPRRTSRIAAAPPAQFGARALDPRQPKPLLHLPASRVTPLGEVDRTARTLHDQRRTLHERASPPGPGRIAGTKRVPNQPHPTGRTELKPR
jgi:hypothetical protein